MLTSADIFPAIAKRHSLPILESGATFFIEELHPKKVKAGKLSGRRTSWGGSTASKMKRMYDRYKGKRTIVVENGKFRLE